MKPYYIWHDVADPCYPEEDSYDPRYSSKAAAKKDAKLYVEDALAGRAPWTPNVKLFKVTHEEVK